MNKLVSVIIPIYNVENYLNRCIESVVNQTYFNIEIILVDDGSPDGCPKICDEWKEKDKRIIVIHKKNGGLSDARNAGLRKASGELVLFVDSDDYIELDSISRFVDYYKGEDFIVAEATIVYPNGNIKHRIHTNLETNHTYSGGEISILEISKGEWFAPVCYNIYNRRFLINNELFLKKGILHEDNEFQPRLFLKAKKVTYLNYEFYQYIQREDSICNKPSRKGFEDLFITFEEWAKLNKKIEDKKVKRYYNAALCKSYIHTCREYKNTDKKYPEGITAMYLIWNALNVKELVKTLAFILFRRIYVRL